MRPTLRAPALELSGVSKRQWRTPVAPDARGPRPTRPWRATTGMGVTGVVLMAASLAIAALVGGENDALRGLLSLSLPLGAALASTLVPVPARLRGGRVGLALLFAAALLWPAPLRFAYWIAAGAQATGSGAVPR